MRQRIDHMKYIGNLKLEIEQNPGKRHRIILRAIKTAESNEIKKLIREFFKKEFRNKFLTYQ